MHLSIFLFFYAENILMLLKCVLCFRLRYMNTDYMQLNMNPLPQPASLTKQALRQIRNGLVAGELKAGMQLSEVALAEKMGMSRTPVREALILLESQGILEQRPGQGTFVKRMTRYECEEAFEMRETLEAFAARNAAIYLQDRDLVKLRKLCDELLAAARTIRDREDQGSIDEAVKRAIVADLTFHMIVLRSSGNSWVTRIVSDMHLMSRIWMSDRGNPAERSLRRWALVWSDHLRIFRALHRRDGQTAAHWMQLHLQRDSVMALDYYDQDTRAGRAREIGFDWIDAEQL